MSHVNYVSEHINVENTKKYITKSIYFKIKL